MAEKKNLSVYGQAAIVAAVAAATSFCSSAKAAVVIQEIYGDGGFAATGTYSNDYVVLYNAGTSAVNINGYQLETGGTSSALGTTYPTYVYDSTPLAAGQHYLVEGRTSGTFPGVSTLPTPDTYATVDAGTTQNYLYPSYSQGKIGLTDSSGNLLDYIGYGGDAANAAASDPAYEGSGPAGGTASAQFTGTNALTRTNFLDAVADGSDTATENNGADFVVDAPNPQNTASSSVPEPASLGILVSGGALLVARRRKNG